MTSTEPADWAATQERCEFDVYAKRGIVLTYGRGAQVYDADRKAYIDAAGAYGVASVGHGHERVTAAIARQSERLLACPGGYACDVRSQLLEKLTSIAPLPNARSYLCNSGAESAEAAIKFARFTTGRSRIVAARRGFHGRTLGAVSATFDPKHKDAFGPLVPGFEHVSYNDADALAESVTDETAAVLLEVVQGEAGVYVGELDFLRTAQDLCRRRGALLIIDEIQTGFCRTGRMFGCQHFDLEPDCVCLAKGIAGGLPLGATVCGERVAVPKGKHGSTFAGSPLSCAAAIAAIDVMEEDGLDEQAQRKGDRFVEKLGARELPRIREIRHLGLMIGIQLKEKVTPILKALLDRGVLALPAGSTVLRLLPPLTITDDELDTVETAIAETLRA